MMSQPLKWHGGKHYLAKRIIALFPPHVHYVEPYFGGGAVLFAKPREWIEQHSEVVSDIDGGLTNFWAVLENDVSFGKFVRKCQATPFSEAAFWEAKRHCELLELAFGLGDEPHIGWAWAFFIRYRQSRQGLGRDFATLSRTRTRRGMNEQASAWLSAVEGLPEAHERLKRVVILNDDALKVIEQQDGPDTFFYLDPPYLPETRVARESYQHEMSASQHEDLLKTLACLQGKFILSGYPSGLYERWRAREDWLRVDVPIDCKASGVKDKPMRVECLWMNYEAPK